MNAYCKVTDHYYMVGLYKEGYINKNVFKIFY